MNTLRYILLTAIFWCSFLSAFAWGAEGHKMIAYIAYYELTIIPPSDRLLFLQRLQRF